MATAGPGTRNDTLNREARGLAGLGIPASVIEAQLGAAARSAGLGAVEVSKTLASGIKSGQSSPRAIPALEPRTRSTGQAKPPTIDAVTGEVVEAEGCGDSQIDELNKKFAVVSVGGSAVVLRESFDPDLGRVVIEYLTIATLGLLYNNRRVNVGQDKTISLASYWLRHPARRQYERVIFDPNSTDTNYYNLWRGWAVTPKQGDWSKFRAHLLDNLCCGNQEHAGYLVAWMADAIQNPGKRPGVCLVFRGKKGVGKGKWWEHFSALYGPHALQVQHSKQVTGNFNGHLENCLLFNPNEAVWAGDKGADGPLKGLITENFLTIERKGIDARSAPNRVRVFIDGNEDWIVPAGPDERRYFVLDVSDQKMQDAKYFGAIDDEMLAGGREALLYDLLRLDLKPYNLRDVPQTDGLLSQKLLSLHPAPRFWLGCLRRGEVARGRAWTDPIPIAEVHQAYLDEVTQTGEKRKKVEMDFSAEFVRLCPEVKKDRASVDRVQQRCFFLPPLDVCRTAFEKYLRSKLNW